MTKRFPKMTYQVLNQPLSYGNGTSFSDRNPFYKHEVFVPKVFATDQENINPAYYEMVNMLSDVNIAKLINARAGRPCPVEVTKKALLAQAKLIQQELDEFIAAVEASDIEKARDGAVDILVTGLGIAGVWDIPLEEDYRRGTASNLTRIDLTYEDALHTQKLWESRGVKGTIYETTVNDEKCFPVRVDENGPYYYDGDEFPVNKFLKSHAFSEPVYRDIPELKIID